MTVKQRLHQLIEELSEDPSEDERRAFYRRVFVLLLPPRELASANQSAPAERSSPEIVDNSDDAGAWSQLGVPAFARDWASEEDQVYDRLP